MTSGNKKLLETYIMGFFTLMMHRKKYLKAIWYVRRFGCKEMNILNPSNYCMWTGKLGK